MIGVTVPRVARLEDLPYFSSPPIQFTFTQQAVLTLGQYPLSLASKAVMRNNAQLSDNSLIFIRDISFYADIPVLDYQQALQLSTGDTDVPRFSLYMGGNSAVPLLRNPIELGDYFREQNYIKLMLPRFTPNSLLGAIEGTIQQTAALAGISKINLTVEIYCQEIVDDGFIAAIQRKYPVIQGSGL
jgi:hypothetical protein